MCMSVWSESDLIVKYYHFSMIWASEEANSPLEEEAKAIETIVVADF